MKFWFALFFLITSCGAEKSEEAIVDVDSSTVIASTQSTTATVSRESKEAEINTGNTTPREVLSFSQTLIGIPYKYGSADPEHGFDCSGFITYVFNHFNIAVRRSSINFTNLKKEVAIEEAKPGDLVLFTGTNNTIRHVGHMGIITSNINNEVNFIHSTSGKAHGVTVTSLNKYYMGRFLKVIMVFQQNDSN
jgi:cell wall-associated NlpC family hydrolase